MIALLTPVLIAHALAPCALAQATDPGPARPIASEADAILADVRRLDLMNQILPVLLRPEQARKLLAPLESAQEAEARLKRDELAELRKIHGQVKEGLKAARERGEVPSRETIEGLGKAFRLLEARRTVMVQEQTAKVLKAVEETLDAGQIKAAANALDPRALGVADPEKSSDRDRLQAWVRVVLMDPLAYGLLVEISEKKPKSPPEKRPDKKEDPR